MGDRAAGEQRTRSEAEHLTANEVSNEVSKANPLPSNRALVGDALDLLFRVLKRRYENVVYARNITDLDDKINKAAKEAGVPIDVITGRFTRIYHEDMAALGVGKPTIEPRATESDRAPPPGGCTPPAWDRAPSRCS